MLLIFLLFVCTQVCDVRVRQGHCYVQITSDLYLSDVMLEWL